MFYAKVREHDGRIIHYQWRRRHGVHVYPHLAFWPGVHLDSSAI